jgi:hypothetical protein
VEEVGGDQKILGEWKLKLDMAPQEVVFRYGQRGLWYHNGRPGHRKSAIRGNLLVTPRLFDADRKPEKRLRFVAQKSLDEGARALLVESTAAAVHEPDDIERTIEAFARDGSNGGLLVLPDNFLSAHRELIVALAERYRLPAVYPFRFFVKAGGLLSYGVDVIDLKVPPSLLVRADEVIE